MTSERVSGLQSLMTFVGASSQTQNADLTSGMSFGDVMSKAKNDSPQTDIGSKNTQNPKTDHQDIKDRVSSGSRDVKPKTVAKADVDNSNKMEEPEEISEETMEVLNTAAVELVESIANMLEVEPSVVEDAIESLELTTLDLLDTSKLGDLVLEINGEDDPMALVTNEELLDAVKDLTTMVDATVADLAEDMDMEVSDVENLLENIKEQIGNKDMEMSVVANSDDSIKAPAKELNDIPDSKEVEATDDSVNSANQNGVNLVNETKDTEADNQKEESQDGSLDKKSSEEHENHAALKDAGISYKNPILENLINVNETTESVATSPYSTVDSQEVMDQIMDYVRVNMKEDVSELEMQLHPASLGNVKINLISQDGELTAQFKVQNEQVKAALESQIEQLKETMELKGTKVNAIEVQVETQGFDANLWNGQERGTNGNPNEGRRPRPRRINLGDIDALFNEEASDEEKLAAEMLEATGGTVDYTA